METSLRARLRDGDPAAFATLFDAHAGVLHGYAARVTGDWATAEDVVSLTFLEAWRLRAGLRPDGPPGGSDARRTWDTRDGPGAPDGRDGPGASVGDGLRDGQRDGLRAWLFGIATNVLRNVTRSARRHRAALERLPPRTDLPDFSDDLVDRVVLAEELAAARRALTRLRRGEREVLALVVWSGLDYAEAAEALGCRVGTVKSRLSRARARLKALAQDELQQTRRKREPPRGFGQLAVDRVEAVRPSTERRGSTR